MLLEVGDGGDEHAGTAAGGVVDGLARPGLKDLGHQVDDRAVGIELLGRMTRVVCELLEQVLVTLAELVFRAVGDGQSLGAEVFDQVFEQTIGKALLVGPGSVTEDTPQLGVVGRLYGAKGVDDGLADVLGGFSDIGPMGTVGNGEAVVLGQGRELFVAARGLQGLVGFLIVDVGEAFEE